MLIPPAAYLARFKTNYIVPTHPGAAPVHAANAKQAQITETNRAYQAAIKEFDVYQNVKMILHKMIIDAVDPIYLSALEDADLGLAEVTPMDMLEHLEDAYTEYTQEDIENNRESLKLAWNPDTPIETLWLRIKKAKEYATRAGAKLSDTTVMHLTVSMFEREKMFPEYVRQWHDTDAAAQTYTRFQTIFKLAVAARQRTMTANTAGAAGYDGAALAATRTSSTASTQASPQTVVAAEHISLYYCWTHGLSANPRHNSATCQRRAEGHKEDATATDIKGGNNCFYINNSRRAFTAPTG